MWSGMRLICRFVELSGNLSRNIVSKIDPSHVAARMVVKRRRYQPSDICEDPRRIPLCDLAGANHFSWDLVQVASLQHLRRGKSPSGIGQRSNSRDHALSLVYQANRAAHLRWARSHFPSFATVKDVAYRSIGNDETLGRLCIKRFPSGFACNHLVELAFDLGWCPSGTFGSIGRSRLAEIGGAGRVPCRNSQLESLFWECPACFWPPRRRLRLRQEACTFGLAAAPSAL